MSNYEYEISHVDLTIAASSRKAFEALWAPVVSEEQIYLRPGKVSKGTITYEMGGKVGEFYGTIHHWDTILTELPHFVTRPCTIIQTETYREDEKDYLHKITPKKATKELLAMLEAIHTNITDGQISVTHENGINEAILEWENIIYESKPNKGESRANTPITVYVRSALKIQTTNKGYKVSIDGKAYPQQKEDKAKDEALKIVKAWIGYYQSIPSKR